MNFKNKIFCYIGFTVVIFIAALSLWIIFSNNKPPHKNKTELIRKNYKIYAPDLPETLYFANEKVPLENYDTRRGLDYEILKIMYWHSETILYLKRANEIFPIVEKILKQYKIPDDFKYLLVAESGMVNTTSPAGAKGYWQFMKNTAKEYGLEINDDVDERLNLEKSTIAACKYIKDAYNQFNSWTLAAAAYNIGKDALKKQLQKQKVDNFYDLLLNRETSRYIYRILAYKLIFSNPRNYGFVLDTADMYKPVKTITISVDTSITNLIDFAQKQGTNYRMLKILNPWLISNKLTNKKHKTYKIKIITLQNRKTYHF